MVYSCSKICSGLWNLPLLPGDLSWDHCGLSHSEVWRLSEGVWLTNSVFTLLASRWQFLKISSSYRLSCIACFQPYYVICSFPLTPDTFFFPTYFFLNLIPSPLYVSYLPDFAILLFLSVSLFFPFVLPIPFFSPVSPSSRKAERRMSVLKRQKEECVLKEEKTRHYMGAVISVAEHISQERDQLIQMVLLILILYITHGTHIVAVLLLTTSGTKYVHAGTCNIPDTFISAGKHNIYIIIHNNILNRSKI